MGKALLILVLSSSVVLVTQLFSTIDGESKTAEDQREYQQEVIAREIAQSAFNVGMGEVRAHGERVQAGVRALNGVGNVGRKGSYSTGRFAGGSYTVRADLTSGHSVRVVAKGTYGDATFTMHDEYRVPVLTARRDGLINVQFVESMAGYCSAVFYEAYTLDMPAGAIPKPVMLFAADNRDRRTARPAQQIYVEAGTQMNFFIAVDKNCSLQRPSNEATCSARSYAQNYTFKLSDWDHVHDALDVESGSLDQAQEAVWAFIEQKPDDRQRWRIGWEDLHYPQWDDAGSDDPQQSLQALKRLGYNATGWTATSATGYATLADYYRRSGKPDNGQSTSYRPDFSDQVIEITVVPVNDPDFVTMQEASRSQQKACGEPVDEPVVEPTAEPTPNKSEPPAPPPANSIPDDELTEHACDCTKNGTRTNKYPILHRPPGNESNEKLLCLPKSGIDGHMKNHNDVRLTCNARKNVRSNNHDD